MKKLLLSLMAMFAFTASYADTEVTFDFSAQGYENGAAIETITIDENVSATFDKGTNSNGPKYYTTGTALRMYGANSMTLTTTSGKIKSVVFTFSSGEGTNAIEVNAGSFATDTWTGSEEEVIFTIGGTSGHRRIKAIAVTYGEAGTDPVAVEGVSLTDGNGNALGMYTQMTVTETIQLKAVVTPSNATNKKVTWEVMQNEEVISFDEATGKVTALKAGQAAVVATTEDGEKQAATTFVVSDIQDGTIADFIATGGKTCYLTGVVSNIQNTTYGNFDLTDESGTIYVYGCLTPAGESKKFADLGVSEGDKIKVLASTYEFYKGETHEAKNVIFVENYGKPATYRFEINAGAENFTVTPSDATVMYLIDVLPEGIFEKYEIDDIDGYYDDMVEEYGSGLEYFKGTQTQSYEEDWYIEDDGVYEIRVFAVSPEYKRISEITMVKTPLVTSIQEIKTNDGKVIRINLAGQQVGANAKGIVIMNGKKVLVK